MSNFSITLTYGVEGWTGDIWAWWILAVGGLLMVLALSLVLGDETDFAVSSVAAGMIFLAIGGLWMLIQSGEYSRELRQAEWDARTAALTELGFTDIIVDSDAYALTKDGNTALYTVTSNGDTYYFHQITE